MGRSRMATNRHSNLSFKISFISILIVFMVLGVYAYETCTNEIAVIDEQNLSKVMSMISAADVAFDNKADFSDKQALLRMCENLAKTDSSVIQLGLVGLKSNLEPVVIASTNKSSIGSLASANCVLPMRQNRPMVFGSIKLQNNDWVEIIGPIHSNGRPVASLCIRIDLEKRDIAVRNAINRALSSAAIAIIAIAVLIFMVIRMQIFKPLWQLAADAQEIARGNFKRRSLLRRNDELGELSREIDIMAMFLEQRDEENQRLMKSLKEKWERAEAKSQTDFLTNLENHRAFHAKLENELERSGRDGTPLALLFCDLDKFKLFNDTNGHPLGDKALFDVARIIRQSIRMYDVGARYGGEEFAIILPNTDVEEALLMADRMRLEVASHQFTTESGTGSMTISIGVAVFPTHADAKELLITAADYAMYDSKKLGGNKVSLFNSFGSQSFGLSDRPKVS